MRNLTIDGRQIEVPAGTRIIEACKQAGVMVPHFCYHPGLSIAGVCRMCQVEIEGAPDKAAVMKALSAMLRTGESFGVGHLVDILVGTETDKVRARGHERLPTFGVGKDIDRRQWAAIFRQMMGHDLIRPDPERHRALRMTEAARPILRERAARVVALMAGRTYVTPQDVKDVGLDVLRHRLILTYEAEAENVTSEEIINRIVNEIEVP